MNHFFEDLQVGQSASVEKIIADEDVQKFGDISLDRNPVHFDEEYAKTTRFGGRIAHGMLTASLLSGLFGNTLPGPGCIYLSQTLKFKAPVKLGATAVATVTVKALDAERKRAVMDCVCRVGDTVVIEGEALLMVPSRT